MQGTHLKLVLSLRIEKLTFQFDSLPTSADLSIINMGASNTDMRKGPFLIVFLVTIVTHISSTGPCLLTVWDFLGVCTFSCLPLLSELYHIYTTVKNPRK